ncbi:MAG: hypothetical protein GXP47_11535 [Acidobacteria bacterium]|nr:hypothetical protein [Acidobacteriota bacterium]
MWMAEEIARRGGAVPFRDFMELALYHPEHGYYSSPTPRYGRAGDYLTAPTASPWYARTVARLAADLASRLGPLTVADLASGDGSFLEAFLEGAAGGPAPVIRRAVSIETSAALRGRQRARLGESVEIARSLADVPPAAGPTFVHASELFDALPVHRVVQRPGGLQELWVRAGTEGLEWEERPAPAGLVDYFRSHGVRLVDGQVAEVNQAAGKLYRRFLEWAGASALVLVLDYGYAAARLYNPRGRRGGSLAVFSQHRADRDPLVEPGGRDITAHVNWDDLRRPAVAAGFREIGLWPLGVFLLHAGLPTLVDEANLGLARELDAESYAERQELKRLLDPDGMGTDLKVLVHGRGPAAEAAGELLAPQGLPRTL